MKRFIVTIAASLLVSSVALAQDADAGAAPMAAGKESKCKANNADGSELVGETTGAGASGTKALIACTDAIRTKVKEMKCTADNGGTKFEYTFLSEFAPGKWTKGTKNSITCPKPKKGEAPKAGAADAGAAM